MTKYQHPTVVGVVWAIGCTCRKCLTMQDMEKAERHTAQRNASIFHTWDMEEHYASMVCNDCGRTFGEAADKP